MVLSYDYDAQHDYIQASGKIPWLSGNIVTTVIFSETVIFYSQGINE